VDGARAEVFASANMEHPHALATAGKGGPVVLFARNRLCALVRPGLSLAPATLLERMLDPGVKIGLWWLGKLLYPHLFPKDLQELTRKFYPRYYHVTPDVAQIDRVLAGRG